MESYEIEINGIYHQPLVEFEVSDIGIPLNEFIDMVQGKYPKLKFNRTEQRYYSCIMAIFEQVV